MARVLYGAVITELKGKVGGSVFQSNRYGFTMKNKGMSKKPASFGQSLLRQGLTDNAKAWAQLTPSEREAWDAIAPNYPHNDSFGNPVVLTGFNLFVKLSMNLLLTGAAKVLVASLPAAVFIINAASFAVSFGGGTFVITFTPSPVDTASTVLVYASPPVNAGQGLIRSKMRFLTTIPVGTASPVDIAGSYASAFGALPPAGSKVHVSLKSIANSNGTSGPYFNLSQIVSP